MRFPRPSSLGFRFDWLQSASDGDIIRFRTAPDMGAGYAVRLPPPLDTADFELLVVGDTGDSDGFVPGTSPQDAVARYLTEDAALPQSRGRAEAVLHLGDVVYTSGEARMYPRNFHQPYAPFLSPAAPGWPYCFRIPFLPVPGNHDYCDFAAWATTLTAIPGIGHAIRRVARRAFAYEVPRGGSNIGGAFMDAFVDHSGRSAPYSPGVATALPNRYYRFSYGCADFFALDSNTLAAPSPVADGRAPEREPRRPGGDGDGFDGAQLHWLQSSIEQSVRLRPTAWRIVYLHHPLYTALTNYCETREVVGVRENLLDVLRERVDLVLSGHAHAFEWLRSRRLPHTALIISGGGGQVSLRQSVLAREARLRHAARGAALRRAGVVEAVVSGRGPAAPDGEAGGLYHYLRLHVTRERLEVRPIGVRRLAASGYRREAPLPAFHVEELTDESPGWRARRLEAILVRRGHEPVACWAPDAP